MHFRYSLLPKPEDTSEEPKNDALASHENPSGGDLVLGHASLLTCCLLTPDEDFIITSDRDEHIRVSWYPEGYVIEAYCLGHEKCGLLSIVTGGALTTCIPSKDMSPPFTYRHLRGGS